MTAIGGVVQVGSKISFLVGAGVGYVLGSRAGRSRYEQIKSRSQQLWQSEPVQNKVSGAGEAIKAAAPVVADKVGTTAKHVGGAAKSKLTSDSSDDSSPDGSAPAGGTSYSTQR